MRAFIAAMKLRELRDARARLRAAYDQIERDAAGRSPQEALGVLAAGLAAMKLGARRVHPEVGSVEVARHADGPTVARWIERLRAELRQGRARAEVLPVFGGLLGERLRPDRALPAAPEGLDAAWRRPSPEAELVRALDARVDPARLARAREIIRARCAEVFSRDAEVPTRPARELLTDDARRDAEALAAHALDPTPNPLSLDWDAALRLAWEDIPAWDWPASGATSRPVWTRNRWRLRPVMDLPTATLVERLGEELRSMLDAVSGRGRLSRALRLRRLEALKGPPIIIENEARMLAETVDLLGAFGGDALGPEGSVARHRAELRALATGEGYDYAESEISRGAAWLAAESELARAHGRDLCVLRADLEDFYPSVSHALVTALLTWLGVDPRLVAVVGRALAMPLPGGGRASRGLPLGLTLSRALGEFLVAAMMGAARAAAPVEGVALVDDIVLVAPDASSLERAWSALRATAASAGLALSAAKCGSVGGGAGSALPAGPVRWGLLRYTPQGLRVDAAAVDDALATTRAHAARHGALLDRAAAWREQIRYAWVWLAPMADLGEAHRAEVAGVLERYRAEMVDDLEAALRERFGASLPRAWLHWPLTAGGLGAPFPAADVVPLALAAARRVRDAAPAPAADPSVDGGWGAWFAAKLEPLKAEGPAETPAMHTLEERFVARGERVGRVKGSLSTYWRWVLHTLGPDVLDAYGTFDFVATDLVPIELVRAAATDASSG